MRKLLFIVMLAVASIANAQHFSAPSKSVNNTDSTTTFTYIPSDNKEYKVYRSSRGSYYIWKLSKKSGKNYKYYLPLPVQEQMIKQDPKNPKREK